MDYKGKCLNCIPVEHGCLAFAIISAVGTGVMLVGSIIVGLMTIAGVIVANHKAHNESVNGMRFIAEGFVGMAAFVLGIAVSVVALASLIAFIFSVLLCNGICNRRPGQVKAYFVYGVVITVLAVLASVAELCAEQDPRRPGIIGLLGCAIYSLFLVMVHKTYAKLLKGTVFAVKGGHVRLVES